MLGVETPKEMLAGDLIGVLSPRSVSRLLVALAVAALTVIAAMTTAGAALGASGDTYVQTLAKLTGTVSAPPPRSSLSQRVHMLGTSVAV